MDRGNLKIAVLSGKGGAGKTLVAVNLAAVAPDAVYLDCDVEEPNGHLFFKPSEVVFREVFTKIPQVDQALCGGCRHCVDFCRFNALAYVGNQVKIFEDVCHSCGGCVLICPQQAMSEKDKPIGQIKGGLSEDVRVVSGFSHIGQASGVPIIKEVLATPIKPGETVFIDCPPGSACSVMESIKDADYCVLVAEPTIFGVHNLAMVDELVNIFGKRFGVVLNKALTGNNPAEDYCLKRQLKVLGRIPFSSELGEINSNARIAVRENESYRQLFQVMLQAIIEEVPDATAPDS